MNLIDLFDDNFLADREYHRNLARHQASEPCPDDWEATTFLDRIPEESDHEDGSPLRFRGDYSAATFDQLIQAAYRQGF